MNFLTGLWSYKCPRCRKGDLFIKPFNIKKPIDMHERCSHCDLKFEAEPGYFFGALFISYIWTGFVFLGIFALAFFVLNLSVNISLSLVVLFSILTYFFILRISRAIYIYIDVPFDQVLSDNPPVHPKKTT